MPIRNECKVHKVQLVHHPPPPPSQDHDLTTSTNPVYQEVDNGNQIDVQEQAALVQQSEQHSVQCTNSLYMQLMKNCILVIQEPISVLQVKQKSIYQVFHDHTHYTYMNVYWGLYTV